MVVDAELVVVSIPPRLLLGVGTCLVGFRIWCFRRWTRSGGPSSRRALSDSVRASIDSWRISSVILDRVNPSSSRVRLMLRSLRHRWRDHGGGRLPRRGRCAGAGDRCRTGATEKAAEGESSAAATEVDRCGFAGVGGGAGIGWSCRRKLPLRSGLIAGAKGQGPRDDTCSLMLRHTPRAPFAPWLDEADGQTASRARFQLNGCQRNVAAPNTNAEWKLQFIAGPNVGPCTGHTIAATMVMSLRLSPRCLY